MYDTAVIPESSTLSSIPRVVERQDFTRRDFIKIGVKAGAGLLLGFRLTQARGAPTTASTTFAPNAFIRIDRDGYVNLIIPYIEMGQGIYTSIAMLIAEELEVGLDQVRVEHAPPNEKLYGNPILSGVQGTGASTSIRAAWQPLRQAGATARVMLVTAAANRWGTNPVACHARRGQVVHEPSNKTLKFGELVDDASLLTVPDNVVLKRPEDFKLIGTPAKRLDTPDKVKGAAVFGIDARPLGVKVAALAQSPVFGGKLKRVDDTAARGIKGVQQIVVLDDAVAVVADHYGAAKKGLLALAIEWDEGPYARLQTEDIVRELEHATLTPGAVAETVGDPDAAIAGAAKKLEATYHVPFLAHAAMEPMNCTVHVRPDGCEVWVGSQVIARAQAAAAKVTGFPLDRVIVHNHLIGGGFGRRLEIDGVTRAVQIARHVESPVKVIWSREEDIQHDMYRPTYYDRISAGLDEKGNPVAWLHRFAGSAIIARWLPPGFQNGLDPDAIDAATHLPYSLPNLRVEYLRVEPAAVPTAFWRSVGPSHNVFVVESFLDELAAAAKEDPVAYRRNLLGKSPRALAVLELAASKAGWGAPLTSSVGRGVALYHAFGTYLAQVAEVEISVQSELRIRRVVCAVDCGIIVNPDTVQAQIESGILFGLGAALYGRVSIKNGRVEQSNFHDYRVVRLNETPTIEVHLVRNSEAPGGLGEVGTPAIAPAVANAVFAVTGKRLRRLPLEIA